MFVESFRSAYHSLRVSRGFSLAAILSLAIGIGGNVAMFSLVNAIVLRSLDYPEPERLVSLLQTDPKAIISAFLALGVCPIQFLHWRKEVRSFESIAIARKDTANLTGNGEPETLGALRISAQFFETLQVRPQLGRWFHEWEEQRGAPDVVILSDALWRRKFAADPKMIGRKILLGGIPHEVIGVTAPRLWLFRGRQFHRDLDLPDRLDIFVPLHLTVREEKGEPSFGYVAIARLKPGVTPEQAQAEVQTTIPTFTYENNEKINVRAQVELLHATLVGPARKGLFVLLGAAGFVLLMICVNVANLLLVRAAGRQRELAIRAALGASRWHLLADSLVESFLLSATGTVVGWALASWITELVVVWAPADVARIDQTHLDGRVLAFTVILTVVTALVFGLLPAWRVSRLAPQDFLHSANRGNTDGPRGSRLRAALVGFEAALGTVLLIGAGLFLVSFQRVLSVQRGFRSENILSVDLSLPPLTYERLERQVAFFRRVRDGLASVPGVLHVAAVSTIPLTPEWNNAEVVKEGTERIPIGERPVVSWPSVSRDYFAAMNIPLHAGRLFQDEGEQELVAVISEAAAHALWPGEYPIGRRFRHYFASRSAWLRVIGVVGDVRSLSLDQNAPPLIYRPYSQRGGTEFSLIVRTALEPQALKRVIREQVWRVDSGIPVHGLRSMTQIVSQSVAGRRLQTALLGTFAAVAVLLAAIGVYGVVAYSVLQRRREIAVRLALGADQRDVRALILRHGMVPVFVGLAFGIIAAIFATRLIGSLLFEVRALDPITFLTAPLLLALAGGLPCYRAAQQAARTDPAIALQSE